MEKFPEEIVDSWVEFEVFVSDNKNDFEVVSSCTCTEGFGSWIYHYKPTDRYFQIILGTDFSQVLEMKKIVTFSLMKGI